MTLTLILYIFSMASGFLQDAAKVYTVSVGMPHTPPSSRIPAIFKRPLVSRELAIGHGSSGDVSCFFTS